MSGLPISLDKKTAVPKAAVCVPTNRLLQIGYWGMAIICLWNLNGLTSLIYETNQLLSAVILGCGLLVLWRCKDRLDSLLDETGKSFVAFILLFVVTAAITRFEVSIAVSYLSSLFLVIATAAGTRHEVRRLGLRNFVVLLILVSGVGAWTVFLSPYLGGVYARMSMADRSLTAGRFTGFFGNPNETGFAANVTFILCCAYLLFPSAKRRFLVMLALPLTSIGMLLSFSRSAVLALAAWLGVYVTFFTKVGKKSFSAFILSLTIATAAYWFFTGGYHQFNLTREQHRRVNSIERMLTGQEVQGHRDLGGRISGAAAAISYWLESPFLGHGLGTLQTMPDRYLAGRGCHNMHMTVLGESGVIGAFAYLVFLGHWGVASWRSRNAVVRCISCGLFLMYCMYGMASHNVLEARNYNVMMGICFGLLSLDPAAIYSKGSADRRHDGRLGEEALAVQALRDRPQGRSRQTKPKDLSPDDLVAIDPKLYLRSK